MQKEMSRIFKAAIWNQTASLAVLDTSVLVQEAARRHRLSPVPAAALGRVLTASAYLCSWLKEENERLSVTFEGDGRCGKARVTGDGALRLTGSLEYDAYFPRARRSDKEIAVCLGNEGLLTVTRDEGRGLPFTGACRLAEGNVVSDFAAYFEESEQRPTTIRLFEEYGDNEILRAGGVFVQPLPGAEGVQERAEEILSAYALPGGNFVGIMLRAFEAENVSVREINFSCGCSREKAERAVLTAGKQTARRILEKEGVISVHCHDCNIDYRFTEEDVEALFGGKESHE